MALNSRSIQAPHSTEVPISNPSLPVQILDENERKNQGLHIHSPTHHDDHNIFSPMSVVPPSTLTKISEDDDVDLDEPQTTYLSARFKNYPRMVKFAQTLEGGYSFIKNKIFFFHSPLKEDSNWKDTFTRYGLRLGLTACSLSAAVLAFEQNYDTYNTQYANQLNNPEKNAYGNGLINSLLVVSAMIAFVISQKVLANDPNLIKILKLKKYLIEWHKKINDKFLKRDVEIQKLQNQIHDLQTLAEEQKNIIKATQETNKMLEMKLADFSRLLETMHPVPVASPAFLISFPPSPDTPTSSPASLVSPLSSSSSPLSSDSSSSSPLSSISEEELKEKSKNNSGNENQPKKLVGFFARQLQMTPSSSKVKEKCSL